jgi:hypothetical protein
MWLIEQSAGRLQGERSEKEGREGKGEVGVGF